MAKPFFNKKSLLYYREEKNDYLTIVPKKCPEARELIINPTANNILGLCNGTNSIKSIIDLMLEKYNVPLKILENDVYKILSTYSRLGVVEWIGGNDPFMHCHEITLDDGYDMVFAHERDIAGILNLLESLKDSKKNEILSYKYPFAKNVEYSELQLRAKLFSFSEEFFLLKKDGIITGLISFIIPVNLINTACTIGLICIPIKKFNQLLHYAIQTMTKITVCPITKVRCYISHEDSNRDLLRQLLVGNSFIHEGLLKKEINNIDVDSYSLLFKVSERNHNE